MRHALLTLYFVQRKVPLMKGTPKLTHSTQVRKQLELERMEDRFTLGETLTGLLVMPVGVCLLQGLMSSSAAAGDVSSLRVTDARTSDVKQVSFLQDDGDALGEESALALLSAKDEGTSQ